jgi:uncharacterized protein YchJ
MSPRLRFACLALALLCGGCHRITNADQRAAVECVRANLAAMEKGDVDAVMATIHPKSPAFLQTPQLVQSILAQYRLTYELETAEVEQATSEGIRVHFVQVTRKLEGPEEFPDNRVDGLHLLKRDGKAWKIWFTQVRTARTLDGAPLPSR